MTKEEILKAVYYDLEKAKAINEWLNEDEIHKEPITTNHDAIIEVYHSEECDGVLVRALGEDFVIGLHDLDDGNDDFDYDEAMSRLKELNMNTFNRKQAAIICIYLDQINEKLVKAGGDAFADDGYITKDFFVKKEEFSSAVYGATSVWCFNGANGCLRYEYRCHTTFRCRQIFYI